MTVLRSRDGGQTWYGLAAPFGVSPLVALQAIPGSSNAQSVSLIAATYNERQNTICIWRSDDEGERWTRGADSFTAWPVGRTRAQRRRCWRSAPRSPSASQTATWRQTAVGETGMRRVASNGTVIVALAGTVLWRSG